MKSEKTSSILADHENMNMRKQMVLLKDANRALYAIRSSHLLFGDDATLAQEAADVEAAIQAKEDWLEGVEITEKEVTAKVAVVKRLCKKDDGFYFWDVNQPQQGRTARDIFIWLVSKLDYKNFHGIIFHTVPIILKMLDDEYHRDYMDWAGQEHLHFETERAGRLKELGDDYHQEAERIVNNARAEVLKLRRDAER